MHAGGYFDHMIQGPNIRQLIAMGFLSRPIVYGPPSGIDLSGIHMVGGDYDGHELANRIDKPKITGSAIDHYLSLSSGQPAITFCATVAHAEHVAAEFNGHGIRSMCIHGKLTGQQREYAIRGLGDGTFQNLTSCNLVSEGTDIPTVNTAIGLRPTASLSLCLQQWGRVLRIYPGKTHAVILDHVGNCFRHGLPTDLRAWSLDGYKKKKKGDLESVPRIKRCLQCFAIIPMAAAVCPQCGYATGAGIKDIKQVDGELVKIETDRLESIEKKAQKIEEWRASSLADFIDIAERRGYDKGWAYIRWNTRKFKMGQRNAEQERLALVGA
jgi:superfamily II DNA or RNA helicase